MQTVKSELETSAYDTLEEVAGRVRKELRHIGVRKRGRPFGVGNLVPFILEKVIARYPELLSEVEQEAIEKVIAKFGKDGTEDARDEPDEPPPKTAAQR